MKKISKKQTLNFFTYYGWTIPTFLVAFWVIFFFIFQNVYAAKRYQKLVIFYAAYNLKDKSLHSKLKENLKPYGCLEIDYYSYALNDSQIVTNYNALKDICDYSVLSEQDLKDMKDTINSQYMSLTNDFLKRVKAPTNYEYYSYNDTKYGFKIYDKDNETYNQMTGFDQYVNFVQGDKTDNFYLVAHIKSVNFNDEKGHVLGYYGLEYLLNGTITK